jgi:hypothetical protein
VERAEPFNLVAERATTTADCSEFTFPSRAMVATATRHLKSSLSANFQSGDGITVELTRRREFIQASPDQS